ncbi:hypothetical protein B0H14DRAFT_2594501 [Mycena olivaceomarginata]|nr:hypothetical protein B0H14DRAFT_2594501 [Mycena olivaceomarginata]
MVGSRSASGGGGSAVATRGGGTTSESGGVVGGCARATSCAKATPGGRGTASERVQRSNEWVGRAMGGSSGGTASRGSDIVGGEVGVAIGNGAGPGKGRGPKGRLANVLGIAARKNERLQRTGVIMERFETLGRPPKPYRTELQILCAISFPECVPMQQQILDYREDSGPKMRRGGQRDPVITPWRRGKHEHTKAPTHSDNDDATPYEPVASFAHLRRVPPPDALHASMRQTTPPLGDGWQISCRSGNMWGL